MEQGKIIGIILLCAAITFSLRALPFFRNTKSKPHDPGNVVYETAVKWYNDVT